MVLSFIWFLSTLMSRDELRGEVVACSVIAVKFNGRLMHGYRTVFIFTGSFSSFLKKSGLCSRARINIRSICVANQV